MDMKDNIALAMQILSSTISVFIVIILVGVTTYISCMKKDIEKYQYGKLVWYIVFGLCMLFTAFMILSAVLGFLNLASVNLGFLNIMG